MVTANRRQLTIHTKEHKNNKIVWAHGRVFCLFNTWYFTTSLIFIFVFVNAVLTLQISIRSHAVCFVYCLDNKYSMIVITI